MPSIFIFFRAVFPVYRDKLFSTSGSIRNGGRFNPKGEFGALYLGESQAVCEAELERRGIKPNKYHIGKFKAVVGKVLNLTDQKIVKSLKIHLGEVMSDDYVMSQRIGRWAYSKGYDAILYSSVTEKGKALCIFESSVKRGNNVVLLEEWEVDKTNPKIRF